MRGRPGKRAQRPLLRAVMMLLAVLPFTVFNSTAKHLSASLPVAQLAWSRFFFTLLLTFAFLPWRGPCKSQRPVQQTLRGSHSIRAIGGFCSKISRRLR